MSDPSEVEIPNFPKPQAMESTRSIRQNIEKPKTIVIEVLKIAIPTVL